MDARRFVQLSTIAVGIFIVVSVMYVSIMISRLARNDKSVMRSMAANNDKISAGSSYGKVLQINQQLMALNEEYKSSSNQQSVIDQMVVQIDARKTLLKEFAVNNPALTYSLLLSREDTSKFPDNIQLLLEQEILLEGTVKTVNGNTYEIQSNDGTVYEIIFIYKITPLSANSRIRISGTKIDTVVLTPSNPLILK